MLINILTEIRNKKKDEKGNYDDYTKDTLTLISVLLNQFGNMQISRFLRGNGITIIIQLTKCGIYEFDTIKIIINMLQSLSGKNFKESIQNFKK